MTITVCGIWALQMLSCSKDIGEPAVAEVNGRDVTADEFAFAYELAPRSLTSLESEEARLKVLDGIIDRILLAQKAEELALDADDTLMARVLELAREKAVRRELYLKHVRGKVEISEDEERDMFRRSKRSLYIRHGAFRDLSQAREALSETAEISHIPLYPGVNTVNSPHIGEADRITWKDVPGDLADLLWKLEPGEIAGPLPVDGLYHVYRLLDWEEDVILRENDFQASRESIHGILKRRREKELSDAYLKTALAGSRTVVRAAVLNRLTDRLWPVLGPAADGGPVYIPDTEIRHIGQEDAASTATAELVSGDGKMTVEDFLVNYKFDPQALDMKSVEAFRASLANAAALFARNRLLAGIGKAEGLEGLASVTRDLQTKREHLLAEKYMKMLYREYMDGTGSDSLFRREADNVLEELRAEAQISIRQEVLNGVATSDEGLARKTDFIAVQL